MGAAYVKVCFDRTERGPGRLCSDLSFVAGTCSSKAPKHTV